MSKANERSEDRKVPKPLSADEAKRWELHMAGDFVGLRYLRVTQLKRKRKRTAAERKFLARFEADRQRVLRDPKSVLDEGSDLVFRGLLLLAWVLHEKRQQGKGEAQDATANDAMTELSLLAQDLRKDLIRYAENGSRLACFTIFREGKAMANAFSRLALTSPELFRELTERSLTMPSLRARNPAFTCDAAAIAQAVHLAERHHASNIHDNRSRIGALCHQFVAEIVDLIEEARLSEEARLRTSGKMAAPSEWSKLPELKGNAKAWWKAELKERVHREFERMKANPRRNPALWEELEKVTAHGTDSAKRAALEKYCFNKLEQIAGKTVTSG